MSIGHIFSIRGFYKVLHNEFFMHPFIQLHTNYTGTVRKGRLPAIGKSVETFSGTWNKVAPEMIHYRKLNCKCKKKNERKKYSWVSHADGFLSCVSDSMGSNALRSLADDIIPFNTDKTRYWTNSAAYFCDESMIEKWEWKGKCRPTEIFFSNLPAWALSDVLHLSQFPNPFPLSLSLLLSLPTLAVLTSALSGHGKPTQSRSRTQRRGDDMLWCTFAPPHYTLCASFIYFHPSVSIAC